MASPDQRSQTSYEVYAQEKHYDNILAQIDKKREQTLFDDLFGDGPLSPAVADPFGWVRDPNPSSQPLTESDPIFMWRAYRPHARILGDDSDRQLDVHEEMAHLFEFSFYGFTNLSKPLAGLLSLEATCAQSRHDAPHPPCGCGYYGFNRLHQLIAYVSPSYSGTSSKLEVIALCACLGKTLIHRNGVRTAQVQILGMAPMFKLKDLGYPNLAEKIFQATERLKIASYPDASVLYEKQDEIKAKYLREGA